MRILTKLFFLAALATAGACGGKSKSPEPMAPAGSNGGSADGTQQTVCASGGSPQAEGTACGAVFKGCCYADAPTACAAAGCAEGCVQAESMPVQVSCPDAAAQPPTAPN
jgi:hypothetical protein